MYIIDYYTDEWIWCQAAEQIAVFLYGRKSVLSLWSVDFRKLIINSLWIRFNGVRNDSISGGYYMVDDILIVDE